MLTKEAIEQLDFEKVDGLLPAIVQNAVSGRVLMLGYMNRQALEKTLQTGLVTFWSRSKGRLWTKGETSGNFLNLVDIGTDCDNDSLLILARPQGPTCHLGRESCFGELAPSLEFIAKLEQILSDRKTASPESSYTASLYAKGTKRIAQKVGEEAVETALAATVHNRQESIDEASDLVYHLLVLLQQEHLDLSAIAQNLKRRHEKKDQKA